MYQRIRAIKLKKAGICIRCAKGKLKKLTSHCRKCLKYMYAKLKAYLKKRQKDKAWRKADSDRTMARRRRAMLECFNAYGGPKCRCCREKELMFLTLDHINNDGAKQRLKSRGATPYHRLRRLGYPPGLQVLCYNCNCGRHRNGGICPHNQ